jgi:hypothetical protein
MYVLSAQSAFFWGKKQIGKCLCILTYTQILNTNHFKEKIMLKRQVGFLGVLFMAAAVYASDFFPAKVGNKWEFDYESFEGHSAGGKTDSGIVTWVISAIEQQGNTKKISITQKRNLRRSTYFMVGSSSSYDSTFNPPRELPAVVISFVDSGNVLYRSHQLSGRQSTEVLVHDPKGAVPSGICVHDTAITVCKSPKTAKLVITGSCDLSQDFFGTEEKHPIFDFFFQCDGIGPVEYHYDSHGTSMMTGGHSWENWTLRSLPASINRNPAKKNNIVSGNRRQTILLVNESLRPNFTAGSVYDLYGRTLRYENRQGKSINADGVYIRLPENKKNFNR